MLEVHINAPKAIVRQSPSGSSSQVRLDMAPFTNQPPKRNGIKLDPFSTSRFLKVLETVILAKSPHSCSWPDWPDAPPSQDWKTVPFYLLVGPKSSTCFRSLFF